MSRVSARHARPPSSSTTYGHLLLESNDTTILPARCRGGRITSPQRAARTNTAFPRDSLRRRGSRGEPSIASLPGMARELLPVGRRARPPRLRERGGGRGAGKGGTAAPSCRGFTSCASRRAAGPAGPTPPSWFALSRLHAHLGARTRSGPPCRPPLASYSGGAGRLRAGHRPLPMAGAASPARPPRAAPGGRGRGAAPLKVGASDQLCEMLWALQAMGGQSLGRDLLLL